MLFGLYLICWASQLFSAFVQLSVLPQALSCFRDTTVFFGGRYVLSTSEKGQGWISQLVVLLIEVVIPFVNWISAPLLEAHMDTQTHTHMKMQSNRKPMWPLSPLLQCVNLSPPTFDPLRGLECLYPATDTSKHFTPVIVWLCCLFSRCSQF